MSPEEAAERIQFHAGPESEAFLGMLRPFGGVRREVLADLEGALRAAAPLLQQPQVERGLMGALLAIIHLGRAWALEPGGMLQGNHLISAEEQELLSGFLHSFAYAVFCLLDGTGEDVAFEDFLAP
ncbi:hypothetical protein HPC49_39720 [Pyxidicoccus fallax]|uniref:Uncharacterized protein n=2 Tax=Pyxidicoccus fallax TaxID=394095 RepID=A0A848LTY4_9BACT|nr:hypothetical protein [Pyxidicoccus fallax]NMO21139.1 hypothetical protein [Pyxidicoccus fallax]NPC84327.1 hypothetical protein [Pyxidicoccus fallax]